MITSQDLLGDDDCKTPNIDDDDDDEDDNCKVPYIDGDDDCKAPSMPYCCVLTFYHHPCSKRSGEHLVNNKKISLCLL